MKTQKMGQEKGTGQRLRPETIKRSGSYESQALAGQEMKAISNAIKVISEKTTGEKKEAMDTQQAMTKAERRTRLYESLRKWSYRPDTITSIILHSGDIDVTIAVCAEFKKHGFKVTPQAIAHNLIAWNKGLKSGYRDEKNGYFLFTPCNKNPLEFEAMEFKAAARDWQYTCEA